MAAILRASTYQDGLVTGFRVAALEGDTGERIAEVWGGLAARQGIVRLGTASMAVAAVQNGMPRAQSYEELHAEAPIAKSVWLRFLAPTRLKYMRHVTFLPTPRAIWQFYQYRWETFSSIALPPEFLSWVDWQVHAIEAQIETCVLYVEKQVEWKGIVGEVAYQAYSDGNNIPASRFPEYLRAWQALATLAEFCGTGEKVTHGMGWTLRSKVQGYINLAEPERE